MKSKDRYIVMGFLLFLCCLSFMMYMTSLPPINNNIITVKEATSETSSTAEEAASRNNEILEQIRNEVSDVIGEDDNIAVYRYMLKLVNSLKENHLLDNSNSENLPDFHVSNLTPKSKYWTKSKQKLNIDMHGVKLKTVELVLPFNLSEETREKDIRRFIDVMEVYKLSHTKPKKKKEHRMHMYKKANTIWEQFHNGITNYHLYPPGSRTVETLLDNLSHMKIIYGTQKSGGTQVKMNFTLLDKGQAIFKPMRFPRSQGTLANHFYFNDYERHTAEIAAFHLDRLLGFRRTPPVAGRMVNITRDIFQYADSKFAKTFFVSRANNLCFYGACKQFCDSPHAICGNPVMLEGSMAAMMMPKRKTYRSPWRRSYSRHKHVEWESNIDYCDHVKSEDRFKRGRTLLDLMDLALFDFIMGNDDRHHYELIKHFGNDSYPLHYDHGRAWGKPHIDDISATAPIYQCCMMRRSTVETLLSFTTGPISLGKALKLSLAHDPLNPVLLDDHFLAVDRRVQIVLQILMKCVDDADATIDVVINDGL